jgi:hypothetical protein
VAVAEPVADVPLAANASAIGNASDLLPLLLTPYSPNVLLRDIIPEAI